MEVGAVKEKEKRQRSSGLIWTPEEEAKLKTGKYFTEGKYVKWQEIADEIGTGRTSTGVSETTTH